MKKITICAAVAALSFASACNRGGETQGDPGTQSRPEQGISGTDTSAPGDAKGIATDGATGSTGGAGATPQPTATQQPGEIGQEQEPFDRKAQRSPGELSGSGTSGAGNAATGGAHTSD